MNVRQQVLTVAKNARATLKAQRPCVLWFTGLSGAGKSTIANLVETKLAARKRHTYLLDGDNIRHGLNKDIGFTDADRVENIRRVGEVAKLFVDAGVIVLCSFISPFRAERAAIRGMLEPGEFFEIFVSTPLAVCEARDPKGLYAKARSGDAAVVYRHRFSLRAAGRSRTRAGFDGQPDPTSSRNGSLISWSARGMIGSDKGD